MARAYHIARAEANAATKASLSKLAQLSLGGWDGHEPVVLDSLEVRLGWPIKSRGMLRTLCSTKFVLHVLMEM